MNDESNTGSGVDLRTKLPAGGNRIPPGYIHPSAAFSIRKNQIRAYSFTDHEPRCGDVVYGKVTRLGFHSNLENKSGRLHVLNDGSKSIFVFGNRYAPDHYEGLQSSPLLEPATWRDSLSGTFYYACQDMTFRSR